MTTEILKHEPGNTRLILISAGWGSDGRLYRRVAERAPAGWDVACLSAFDATEEPKELTEGYRTIYLYAWSLGVAAAERILRGIQITRAFAINGTPYPCNDEFGIPESIYDGTAQALTEANLTKFRRRMCGSASLFKQILPHLPSTPNIEALRSELHFIKEISGKSGKSIRWDRAYVSLNDSIIPASNQLNYWGNHTPAEGIVKLDAPHCPDFAEIVATTLPDPEEIGKGFSRASHTYETEATAQQQIALRLGEHLKRVLSEHTSGDEGDLRLLEIGPGTGGFTEIWRKIIHPQSATYIDLYPLRKFGAAREENYIEGDAEEWIAKSTESYDIIVSASVIQWMADPIGFLKEVVRHLRPGGILAISTFRPGNLGELDTLRPSPLPYKTATEIREALEGIGLQTDIEEGEISVTFKSIREALLHIRHTGVGTTGKSGSSLGEIRKALSDSTGQLRLTYRPLWITARIGR